MQSIVVTGAAGYIGRHVVSEMLDQGFDVGAVDTHFDDLDGRAVRLPFDIFSDVNDVYDILGRPDVVLHMAWRDGFRHGSSRHIDDLPYHVRFVRNLLEGGLTHLAVMGSMHEVGYWEGPIDENTPCRPQSMYGIAKNAFREITELVSHEHEAILQWIRAYYIVGDDVRGNSIFSKIAQAAAAGQTSFPFTSGLNKYDFISIDELARQITAIVSQTQINGIVNACSGEPVALGDRVSQYIVDQGFDITLDVGKFPDRPYDSPAVWGDPKKIRQILDASE